MTQAESHKQVTLWRPLRLLPGVLAVVMALAPAQAEAGCPCSVPEAAEILRLEDRRESVDQFSPYLDSEDAETRRRAVLAIGRVAGPVAAGGQAGFAHGALTRLLRGDPDARVRAAAAFSLGLLGTERAGNVVAALLVNGNEASAQVRAAAIEALGKCAPASHSAAMDAALHDPVDLVRRAALLAVWRGAPGRHLDRILELSKDMDADTRWCAAYALMRSLGAPASGRTSIPDPLGLTGSEREEVLDRLLPLADDDRIEVQLQAIRGMGRGTEQDDRWRSRAQARLLAAADRADARVRVEAVRALAGLYAGADRHPDLSRFLEDAHPHVRIAAIRAVAQIAEPPALLNLVEGSLNAALPWERATALEVTTQAFAAALQTAQLLHLVDRGLADEHWMVRYAAAGALAGAASSACTREVSERMQRCLEDDSKVSKAVVVPWILNLAGQHQRLEGVVSAAAGLLSSDDEVLRSMALTGMAGALADSTRPAPTPADDGVLLDLAGGFMRDPSSDVRATLVGFLGQLLTGSERAASADLLFTLARKDRDRLIRTAALGQLRSRSTEEDPWFGELRSIEAGPQSTGHSLRSYNRILEETWQVREAVLFTDSGELRFALYGVDAPLTVYNFVRLAEEGYFDRGAWHRVVPDFVIQDGCPRTDGWGGPGHSIRCEYNEHHYQPGSLGMALAGKDTGGSQFFFALSDQPHLDGRYTIFGRLILGYDVMDRVVQGETIQRIEIIYENVQER